MDKLQEIRRRHEEDGNAGMLNIKASFYKAMEDRDWLLREFTQVRERIRTLEADHDRLAAENERLREALDKAPHSSGCNKVITLDTDTYEPASFNENEFCDCWKRAALGEEGKE